MYPPKTFLEQRCMMFGAIVKALQGQLNQNNVISVLDGVWTWTGITLTAAAVVEGVEAQKAQETPKPLSNGAPEPMISEPQRRRLFAIAKGASIEPESLDEFLKFQYGISSTKQIPKSLYEEICNVVKTGTLPN